MRENSVYCEEAKRWLQVPGIYRHFKHTENGIPNNYMYCTMFVSKPKDIHEFPKNIASYKWMKVFSTEENTQITLILIEGTWYHTKESCKKDMVIYKSLYDEHIPYARPLEMFLDNGAEGREDNKTGQKYRMEAIATWGQDLQLNVAIEELSELTKEICKHKRGADNADHIAEEMADVEIMLEQMKIMFNNHAEVARHKMGKVIRLEQRVNEANKS